MVSSQVDFLKLVKSGDVEIASIKNLNKKINGIKTMTYKFNIDSSKLNIKDTLSILIN